MNGKLHATATHTIRWNLLGSISYELAKAAHHIGLYTIMPVMAYAHISVQFSLIYLTVFIAGLEGGESLLPHLTAIKHSRSPRTFILRHLILPQLLLYTVAATLLQYRLSPVFNMSIAGSALLCLITITEGVRANLRTVLHPLYGAKTITAIENPLTAAYFLYVWVGYLGGSFELTPLRLLIPFAATSLIAMSIFIYKVVRLNDGPTANHTTLPTATQLIKGRFTLCALHLPRNLFSGNFLVPFFAQAVGPVFASVTKVTSEVANAVRALLKTTIGFSLNTLLVKFKQSQSHRDAFTILWQQLNEILISAAIILVTLIPHMHNGAGKSLSLLLGLFIGIAVIDYLFIIYEYFYIMNHQAGRMAWYRGIEALGGVAAIVVMSDRPIMVLVGITLTKAVMFGFAIHHAHARWQVHPHTKIRPWVAGCAIIMGALLSGGISLAKRRPGYREHNSTHQGAARPTPLFQVNRPSQ